MAGEPARNYSWPPFEKGHELSIRHGVWSKRKVEPLTLELATGLLVDRPDLERHPEAVLAWARAEARCLLFAEHFAEHGTFTEDGNERPGLRFVLQFERLAAEMRARLGLDPRSEAELANARADATRSAVDLDAIRQRGREAIEAREGTG